MPQVGIILMENAGVAAAMAQTKFASIANNHRQFTDYEGTSKPSLPDYCAMTSGSYLNSKGVFGGSPAGVDVDTLGFSTANNIFKQVATAGLVWKAYEEGVASAGYSTWNTASNNNLAIPKGAPYTATPHNLSRHCPASFYTSSKGAGSSHGSGRYDFDELARDITNGTLPDFFFITPHSVNDGHDAGLGNANSWLNNGNAGLFPGFDTLIGALRSDGIVILTFDNVPVADTTSPVTGTGKVYMSVSGPGSAAGTVSTYGNHFGMLKAVQGYLNLPTFTTGVDSNYTNATAVNLGTSTTTSAPTITNAAISGTLVVGDTLTASATISGNPNPTVTYTWVTHGTTTPVLGTGTTYVIQASDSGNQLDCIIKASNGISPNATATATSGTIGSGSTVTYQYSLDGGAWTSTGDGGADLQEALSGLSSGVHHIGIRGTNATGTGAASVYIWELNATTPPNAPVFSSVVDGLGVTLASGASTESTTVVVTFTTDVGTTVTVQDNTNTAQSVTSPFTLSSLALGAHTLTLVATNAGGASASATFSFTVISVTHGGPGSGLYTRNITLAGTAGQTVPNTIYFKATDTNASPLTTQTQIDVLVEVPINSGPAVAILDPLDGTTIYSADGNVAITVQAINANDTIASVQLTTDDTTFIFATQQVDPTLWVGTVQLPLDTTTQVTAIATDATDGLTGSDYITLIESTQPPPPPQGQPVPEIRVAVTPPKYNVFFMDHNGNDVGVVTPQDLKLTQPLNAPDTIEFGINLQDPMAKIDRLNPDLHDWRFERNDVPISAGILLGNGIQIDTNSRTMQISGQSWLGYMSTSFMDYDPTQEVTQFDYAAINLDIFDAARGLVDFIIGSNNSIPINYDHTKAGIIITQEWLATDFQDLLTMLTDLGASVQGFDFEIDVNCTLHMYAPHKGSQSNLYLVQFKNIEEVQYTNPGFKANRVIGVGTGTGSTQEVARAENTASQIANRIYTDVPQFSNLHTTHLLNSVNTTNQIDQLTKSELAVDLPDQLTIVVTSRPSPDEDQFQLAGIGDWIHLYFDLEYTLLNGWYRCTQRVLEPDNDGNESIEYTFTPNTINQGSG